MATAPTSLEDKFDTAFEQAVAPPEPTPEPTPEPAEAPEPSSTETPDTPPAEAPESEAAETELLTAEERAEILKDPKLSKSYKLMQGAFTRKTQDLATQRKALEPLQQFSEALQSDFEGTLKKYGLTRISAASPQAQAQVDDAVGILKDALGPESEELAARLAPAFEKLVERFTQGKLAPIHEKQQQLLQESVERETQGILEQFEKAHPDFKKHEGAMLKVMKQIQPGEATEMEYLETCYKIATYDLREADATKKVVAKINAAAQKSESSTPGVPSQRVAKAAPKFESFNDAVDQSFDDAVNGVQYE